MEYQLFQACAMGDIHTFQALLDRDNSLLEWRNVGSMDTPLHLVIRFNHTELALAILRSQSGQHAETDVATARNEMGETPLHEACRVGGLEIARQLLDARPYAAYWLNRANESPLFIACSQGHSEVALELCSRLDFLAWHEIGESCLRMAASKGYADIVRKILGDNPSLANRKDDNGFSALHLASREGKLGAVKEFLGKDPSTSFLKDNEGRTPLHWAVISRQVLVVEEFLLERPRPTLFNSLQVTDLINIADNNGDTVLHLAAKTKISEISNLLVSEPGMKVHAANKEGKTALEISNQNFTRSQGMEATAQGDADHVPFYLKEVLSTGRLMPIYLIQCLAFCLKLKQDEDERKCKNIMPETTIPPWWFTYALGAICIFPFIFLLAKLKTIYKPTEVVLLPKVFIRLAMMLMEIAVIRFLFKFADGGDDLNQLFLFVVASVPTVCIAWTWHKLEYSLLRDTGLRLTKSD